MTDCNRAAEEGVANVVPVDRYVRRFGRVLNVGNGGVELVDVFLHV